MHMHVEARAQCWIPPSVTHHALFKNSLFTLKMAVWLVFLASKLLGSACPPLNTGATRMYSHTWSLVWFLLLWHRPWPNVTWVAKGLHDLHFYISLSSRKIKAGTECGNLKARTEMETRERCCLLVCFLLFAPSAAFLYSPGPPDQMWHCWELTRFTSIN